MPEFTYENLRRVRYVDCGAQYVPVCPKCGKFVKADDSVLVNGLGYVKEGPNATCKQCGRVEMPFEGYL